MDSKNCFSIGKISELTGVTIRTLQYYDNIGLVPLIREEKSGRRIYREKDLAKLYQVLFYKSLGLSIKDIQELVKEEVGAEKLRLILDKQREAFYRKLNDLKMHIALINTCLDNLERNEGLLSGELIQLMIALKKDTISEYIGIQYDKRTQATFMNNYKDVEEVIELYWEWKKLLLQAVTHILNGDDPRGKGGRDFARKWLEMTNKVTKGNPELVNAHKLSYENRDKWPEEDRRLMDFANEFIDIAVETYLET